MSDTTQQIKEKLDIVEFLREYLKVTPAGKNFKANCPFHQEKTPSFMISPERQSWHCFGCSEGGDIIKFLMKYENLEFYDALKILAEKAGIDIKSSSNRDFKSHNALYGVMIAAKDYFIKELTTAELVQKYIQERGLNAETIAEFEVGFASSGSDALMRHLLKLGYSVTDVEKAGLVLKTERGTYWDRFRSRVMFPLYNHFGKVVGFTGRILPGQDNPNIGKYVNSPETPIFQKSKLIYGLHKTKNDIRLSSTAVLVEGQMDFLMAWQDGVKNIVATSGTALTRDHLTVLRRIADNLVVSFDTDDAGVAALERAVDLAGTMDFSSKVLLLSGVKDPAELAQKEPGKLKELVANALPAMQYYFYKYINSLKGSQISEKKKGIRSVLSKIKLLDSAVERSHWLKELSGLTGVNETALFEEMSALKTMMQATSVPAQEIKEETRERRDLISERLIGLVLHQPEFQAIISESLEYFSPVYKDLYLKLVKNETSARIDPSFDELVSMVSFRSALVASTLDPDRIPTECKELLRQLKIDFFKEKRQKLIDQIRFAEAHGDEATLSTALKEFDLVAREMHNI